MRCCVRQQCSCKITAFLRNIPDTSISGYSAQYCDQDTGNFQRLEISSIRGRERSQDVLQCLLANLQIAAHQPSALVFHSISCIFEGTVPKLKFVFLLLFVLFFVLFFYFLFSSGFLLFIRAAIQGGIGDVHRRASDDPPVLRGTGR